ncbi:MAG: phosphatidate cytidylyltransferase [Paracoccaceae bacterium]
MSSKPNKFLDLGTRILSAIVMIAISVLAFWLGGYWAIGFIGLGALVLLWEFHKILRHEDVRAKIDLAIMGGSAVASIYATLTYGWVFGAITLILGAAALYKSDHENWFWLSSGLLYIGACMTAMLMIFLSPEHGLFYVFWVVLIVALTDIGGYFAGRIIGGPKLWPAVSPRKTWAGTMGGWVLSIIAGVLLGWFGPEPVLRSLVISIVIAIASQLGDLLESWLKRQKDVKDSSYIIPGHGGLLDRLDGVMAAALVFAFIQGLP